MSVSELIPPPRSEAKIAHKEVFGEQKFSILKNGKEVRSYDTEGTAKVYFQCLKDLGLTDYKLVALVPTVIEEI